MAFAVVMGFIVLCVLVVPFVATREPRHRKGECRDGHPGWCAAYQYEHCSDGRCKKHCEMWCHCVPCGEPGKIRVLKGGRP